MSKWKIECLLLIVMFPLNSIPAGELLRGTCAWNKGIATVDNSEEMDGLVCLMSLFTFPPLGSNLGLVTRQIFQQLL